MTFRMRFPTGEEQELDDAGSILDLILHKGPDFWNVGSGDAGVERGPADNPVTLGLYFDGRDRFQLRLFVPGEYPAIALDPTRGESREAVIKVGGTPMTLATETLLSRDDTAAIVRHFCETGEKHPDYDWRQ